MNSGIVGRATIGVTIFITVCSLAAWWAQQFSAGDEAGRWYSIVPPFIAIIMAFVTRRVILSLAVAILIGGFLGHLPEDPSSIGAWNAGLLASPEFFWEAFREPVNYQVLIFVPIMFAMVLIIADAHGFDGILAFVSRFVKGRKSAQFATASAGVLYFFDDYSNAMVVGSAMRPLTDRHRVSREKLAFLVDSTSAPIASLALISTWIMYEVGYFTESAEAMGIANSGYSIFLDILQYRFYCIFILALVFLHIVIGRDFGPMKAAEEQALKQTPGGQSKETNTTAPPSVMVAIIPLAGLILFHFAGMWYCGAVLEEKGEGLSPASWIYWRDVIGGSADYVILIFDYSAMFGLILAVASASFLARFPAHQIRSCIWRGFTSCIGPCLILVLAWSLKNCSDALNTKDFLVALFVRNVPLAVLPTIVFLVACVTSFTTGTSWGTMGILIPIVGPVAFQLEGDTYGLITMMSLGAVLDGAIFGDHCSPISDTTILSSTATQCELMKHVRTQMPYSILGAGVALLVGYLPVALGLSWIVSFAFGILAVLAVFFLFGTKTGTVSVEAS